MSIRTLVILALGGVLTWDFFTVGAMNAAVTRAGTAAYEWSEAALNAVEPADRLTALVRELNTRWRQADHAIEAPPFAAPASAETVIDLTQSIQMLGPIAEAPPPSMDVAAASAPYGYSVFSREAIDVFIARAAAETGVSTRYLTHLAERESSFDPVAAAGTSSAKGLYQFTETTWLDLFARHGARYGQEALAGRISFDGARPRVENARARRQILNLRFDPKLSTFMAAHYASEQEAFLRRALDRDPNYAELYIAHFLGAAGAAKLFIAFEEEPDASAVRLFPAAARANRVFFYDANGRGVDIATLYANLLTLCDDLIDGAHA